MTTQTISIVKPSIQTRVLWIFTFAILTAVSAWIRIPLGFTPVPITLQTAIVLLSGVVLGTDGLWSQALYLVLGGIGLPFFASHVPGVQILFGPTGGYLIGFIACSAFVGYIVQPNWNSIPVWEKIFWLLVSTLLIFIPGVIQLKIFTGASISQTLVLGFYPFILGDILKSLVVAFTPVKRIFYTKNI